MVDYALTIAISVAAGASAIIAYLPGLAPARLALAFVLLVTVACVSLFGHGGRAVFALMTISFVIIGSVVIIRGIQAAPVHQAVADAAATFPHSPPAGVLLAFPVGMALATGVEAPSSAIAQLGQLDDADHLRFGRTTLWLMVAIVVWLTAGLAVVGVRLHVALPAGCATWIAQVAQTAVGRGGLFAAFQVSSAVLLLAAASSSFQAGPGLLKALARGGKGVGVLLAFLLRRNRHHTPYWGVAVFLAAAVTLVLAADGQEQRLVLFYAVAVFIAFLCGLASMTRLFYRDGQRWLMVLCIIGGLVVGLTLGTDFARGYPIVSFVAACLLAVICYAMWVRAGRPRGVGQAGQIAEVEDEPMTRAVSADPGGNQWPGDRFRHGQDASGPANRRARVSGRPGADRLKNDRGHHRAGWQLGVADPLRWANSLNGHVDRAGQPCRVGWPDGLIVCRPERQPAQRGGGTGGKPGEQAAPRKQLLAGGRAGVRREPLGCGGHGCTAERRAERDHPPGLAGAGVLTGPQQCGHAARRIADYID